MSNDGKEKEEQSKFPAVEKLRSKFDDERKLAVIKRWKSFNLSNSQLNQVTRLHILLSSTAFESPPAYSIHGLDDLRIHDACTGGWPATVEAIPTLGQMLPDLRSVSADGERTRKFSRSGSWQDELQGLTSPDRT